MRPESEIEKTMKIDKTKKNNSPSPVTYNIDIGIEKITKFSKAN